MSKRKQFTPEQKVAMVRRHLIENVPVSDLCDEFGIHATQYYHWQKQLFENAEGAFARRPNKANVKRQHNAHEKKISQLEEKLQGRNEVVAELMQEHVQLKKNLGNSKRMLGSPRRARPRRRLRSLLEGSDRDCSPSHPRLDGRAGRNFLQLERALRKSQRAQRLPVS